MCNTFLQEKTTQSRKTPLVFRPAVVVLFSILAATLIIIIGSLTDISLGDENPHVRQARSYMRSGTRVPYDALYPQDSLIRQAFPATPLWHAGLAMLWRLTGTESQTLAQVYQASFYLLLLLSVYFGTRRIWETSAASWAWLLIATMPMVCVYSVVLYQDVPGIAVSALAMLLLWRKNFLWAGVCFAAAYLVKANMLSYAPWAVAFAAWWSGGPWKRRLASGVLVAVPVIAAFGYDVLWRLETYGGIRGHPTVKRYSPELSTYAVSALYSKPAHYHRWSPESVYSITDLVQHLGMPLLVAAPFALLCARDKHAQWVWGALGLAAAGFVYWFGLRSSTQIRYLFPILLVLVLVCGRALAHLRPSSWLKAIIVAACITQATAACAYVYHRRQISEWDRDAYAWIRDNTSEGASIMSPERALVNKTGRPHIWSRLNPAYFMTEATDEQRQELLASFRVSYIAIPLRRVYSREREGDHSGGYPRDFVEKARSVPYLRVVYENPGFMIFEFTSRGEFGFEDAAGVLSSRLPGESGTAGLAQGRRVT